MNHPIIGITMDNRDNSVQSGKYESATDYSAAVAQAGGMPVLLAHEPSLAPAYVAWCDGLILTGGADPDTTMFDRATSVHPQARAMDATRQRFETALLEDISNLQSPISNPPPCLGICLGMQLMALHAGGRLNQYLPQTHHTAWMHDQNRPHPLTVHVQNPCLAACEPNHTVVSSHRQAVSDPGRMRVVASASDGVIEAIDRHPHDDRGFEFYLGVQWHPERGGNGPFNLGLIRRFVQAASRYRHDRDHA